jgi:hypothetical protein
MVVALAIATFVSWKSADSAVASERWQPPLFADQRTISISLQAPWREIVKHRSERPSYKALVSFSTSDGSRREIEATITTRGNSRLAHCSFPPLRLDFSRDDRESTLFDGQKRLKIVTRCKRSRAYADYQRLEYLLYQALQSLTDEAFRVRWTEIDYVDSESGKIAKSEAAFFIEDIRSVARRLGMSRYEPATLSPASLEPRSAAIVSAFQYMIGNTDWSMLKAPDKDERCCHNVRLLSSDKSNWIPIPYDFDQSGLIDAEYALPSPSLDISSVRRRLYRGLCRHNETTMETVALFIENQNQLLKVFDDSLISNRNRSRAHRYLKEFFDIVNDPERLQKNMLGRCR